MTLKENIDNYVLVESLPSGFKSYPEGAKVSVKPYTFGDIQNVKKSASTSMRLFYENILTGVKTSFDKMTLTPEDVMYLGIYRNLISSKHTKIVVDSRCTHCMNKNSHVVDLRDVKFKALEIPQLPVVARLTDYDIHFTMLTVENFIKCFEEYKGDSLAALASQVTKIVKKEVNEDGPVLIDLKYDDKDKIDKLRGILGKALDFDKDVLDYVTELFEDYGMKPIDVVCKDEQCRKHYDINLEDKSLLVYPFRDNAISPRDKVEFGA